MKLAARERYCFPCPGCIKQRDGHWRRLTGSRLVRGIRYCRECARELLRLIDGRGANPGRCGRGIESLRNAPPAAPEPAAPRARALTAMEAQDARLEAELRKRGLL